MFSCTICEIFDSAFAAEHLEVTASESYFL